MTGYDAAIETKMQSLFATLSEKDKRRYAGIEAIKLGHGGIDYISRLFDIDPKTIHPAGPAGIRLDRRSGIGSSPKKKAVAGKRRLSGSPNWK